MCTVRHLAIKCKLGKTLRLGFYTCRIYRGFFLYLLCNGFYGTTSFLLTKYVLKKIPYPRAVVFALLLSSIEINKRNAVFRLWYARQYALAAS